MRGFSRRSFVRRAVLLGALGVLLGAPEVARAGAGTRHATRAFAFPFSLADGVMGDLVPATGSSTKFSFESGKVAIGELPVPLPQRAGRRGRGGDPRPFLRPADARPHVRLLLSGVVDADGPVTNSGNQLVIDAVVSPNHAALTSPPLVVPFDINGGAAFVDAFLPIQSQADGGVRVQILGVSVVDPDGQPFGVLGFQLPPVRPTPTPFLTPTPGGTPQAGACFVGRSDCTGASFGASQEECCRRVRLHPPHRDMVSWCPREQIDPASGRCLNQACVACPAPPAPASDCGARPICAGRCKIQCANGQTKSGVCGGDAVCQCSASCEEPPPPGVCDAANCAGPCALTCPDGLTVAGRCVGDGERRCVCSAECKAPTPCGVGQCFDTITFRCTGQTCGPGLHCPLPNQFCDVSGRRCPCEPPPPAPHGRICCQCKEPVPLCFDFQFVEAQPICPPGCETFIGQECDGRAERCVPLAPCAADTDCNDRNGCTIDRCTADGCTHDCVCVGPRACGPGPSTGGHHH